MQILLDFYSRQKVLLGKSLSLAASQAARVATSGEVAAGRPYNLEFYRHLRDVV